MEKNTLTNSQKGNLIVVISFFAALLFFQFCTPAEAGVRKDGKNFTVESTRGQRQSKPGKDTGYTITFDKEHYMTVEGVKVPYKGTYPIMEGSKGGYYFVIGTDSNGKEIKCRNIPAEVKEAIKSK